MLNLIVSSLVSALLSATLVVSSAHAVQTDAPARPIQPVPAPNPSPPASFIPGAWRFCRSATSSSPNAPVASATLPGSGDGIAAYEGAPDAVAEGQGGMLDIALAPDFAEAGHVYHCFHREPLRLPPTAPASPV